MKKIIPLILITAFLTSCSGRLVNNWNIDQFEIQNSSNQRMIMKNIGEVTFNNKNTGKNNIQYRFSNHFVNDNSNFTWDESDTFIVIRSTENSPIAGTWKRATNKKKVQKWVKEDTDNEKIILTLKR